MTEPVIPATVDEAVTTVAKMMVSSSSENGRTFTFFSPEQLAEAAQRESRKIAATKPHFGMRMTKCIPPGGG